MPSMPNRTCSSSYMLSSRSHLTLLSYSHGPSLPAFCCVIWAPLPSAAYVPNINRTLQRLKTVHRITGQRCCTLFEQFVGMLRDKEQKGEEQARSRLEEWPERAKASGIAVLKAFAVKLLQDSEAVVAAMILPYTQGQTEGRVISPRS